GPHYTTVAGHCLSHLPSSLYAFTPLCSKCCSRAVAMVLFPDALRPVSQMVRPCWPVYELRSSRVRPGCHVMFLQRGLLAEGKKEKVVGCWGRTLPLWMWM